MIQVEFMAFNEVPLAQATVLWNQAFSDYIVPVEMSEQAMSNRLRELQLSPTKSLIASVDGELAGIMLYGQRCVNGEELAWIGGMGVHPDHRRGGVGKGLMEEAIRTSEGQADRLLLEVIKGNDKAEALYRQLGFQEFNRVFVGKGQLSDRYVNDCGLSLVSTVVTDAAWRQQAFKTTWQNMFLSPGDLRKLMIGQEQVGYLYCSEIRSDGQVIGLTIKQWGVSGPLDDLVEATLACLYTLYGEIAINVSNFDLEWPITAALKRLGVVERLQQIQMERLSNENLESKL